MSEGRIFRLLRKSVDLKPEETKGALLMALYFFLITSSAYIIKAVKISLFLHRLNFTKLPYAYLVTAVFMGFVVSLNSKLLRSMNRRRYVSVSLEFFLAGLVVFWLLFKISWNGILILYWLWSDVFLVLSVTQFWILVYDLYQPRQAKRFVSFFVSGGLLGGVFGSFLVTVLAKVVGTENLLLLCPVFLLSCLWIVQSVAKAPAGGMKERTPAGARLPKTKAGAWKSFQVLAKSRYLVLLSAAMAVAIIVSTLIDFQFSAIIKAKFGGNSDAQTAFLGMFFTVLLIFSWFLNVLLTNRVLRSFGIRVALLITPLALMIGSCALFFIPAALRIYWGVAAKGADKSLTHTFSQATREVLYIPIPQEIKYKAKMFIDIFVNKLGDGLAAVLLMVCYSLLGFSIPEISLLTLALTAFWMILNVRLMREYVGIVKKNLTIKWPDADKFVFEQIDVDATKLVFDTLESKQRSSVLYAMNLLDLIKRDKLSPELKSIIASKRSEVRAGSFDSLMDMKGEAFAPEWDDGLEERDLDTQVREILSLDVYQELMRARVESLATSKDSDALVSQMEIAKSLGMMATDSPLVQNLARLLRHDSPEVVRYALESAGRQKKREFVPWILPHLGQPATRQSASQALLEYGDKIAGTLKDYLADPKTDIEVRRAVPDILAGMGTQRATDFLVRELKERDPDVQTELIEALTKLRSRNPGLRFSERTIVPEIFAAIHKACVLVFELFKFRKENPKGGEAGELENVLARILKQIFELLSLIYPHEDVMRAYQDFREGTQTSVDYALELLENILKKDIKDALLPLLEERPLDEKAQICRKILKMLEKFEGTK
ncbi:MAG: Npt1/Npt2 family nucleotide transporter [Candidatus Aminicenantales bacterium]